MVKIGFLISKFNHGGGTERVTAEIANGLIKRNYNVDIISCQKGLNPIFKVDPNIKLFSLHGEYVTNSALRKLSNLNNLIRIVKAEKIDILITVDVELYIYAFPLQLMKLCKVIAWEQFNYYKQYPKLEKISQRLAAKYANYLIVISKHDLKNYQNNERKLTNIDYIYDPISINTNKTSNLKNKQVISVGRLEEQKGYDILLKVWQQVEKYNHSWQLVIYGNGTQYHQLLEQSKKLNLKNIKFKSYTHNIQNEYLNSSIYVMSSRYEGFGLVLTEAQASGLPIVSFDCHEGPSEIIDNNVNGYLIKDFDIKAMANALLKLMDNSKLLKSFATKSKKDLYRFNMNDILDKWEMIFRKLLAKNVH